MKFENGVLTTTMPAGSQFDKQIHSVEWFHNGAWHRIPDTIYPLQDSEILDDTLDCGGFCFTNELKPYPDEQIKDSNGNWVDNPNSIKYLKQLTPIRILWDSKDNYREEDRDLGPGEYALAVKHNESLKKQLNGKEAVQNPLWRYRVVDEVNIHNEGRLFKFTVKTVEATKLLELVQCDTLTFTRKLGREVAIGSIQEGLSYTQLTDYSTLFEQGIIKKPDGTATEHSDYRCTIETKSTIQTPIKVGNSFNIPILKWFCAKVHSQVQGYAGIKVVLVNLEDYSETPLFEYEVWVNNAEYNKPHPHRCNEAGGYLIRYYHKDWGCYVEIPFSVVEVLDETIGEDNISSYMDLSIKDVLERILSVGKTRRKGIDSQKFILDEALDDEFYSGQAPEFCITRATIWEALKTVAGHGHRIPRLNWDEETKTFRKVSFDKLGEMQECQLKALHDNTPIAVDVRKSLDSYCGEIDTYVDNLVNTKDEAMGCIVEPYAGGWKSARASDGELIVKDDTVVFNMSRPNMRVSKLEIKYNGKEADITKYLFEAAEYKTLSSFEGSYPHSTSVALKYEQGGKEITEIAHTSNSYTDIIPGIGELFKTEAIINIAKSKGITIERSKFKDIQYRITYSPISSARIVQKKPYSEDCNGYSRVYNVAGNTIESEYLGEHLKGAIARLGNDIEYRTYMFERGKDVPKPGTMLDGKYIMKVTTQMNTVHFIKATLVLSSDYNQKNEYVAIDSSIRYYDVSEKQSYERHCNYGENIFIGDFIVRGSKNVPLSNYDTVESFIKVFREAATNEQVSWVWCEGTTKSYGAYTPNAPNAVLLPCLSQAEGNSLVFNFVYVDNYSAGWRISYPSSSTQSIQTQVSYGNIYGELEDLHFELGNDAGINDYQRSYNDLPLWNGEKPNGILSTGDKPLIISKDSREHLNITVQLHCVANRKTIVIGTALCKGNPLVTSSEPRRISCYFLPYRINKFATTIDVSNTDIVKNGCYKVGDDFTAVHTIDMPCRAYLPSVQNKSGKTMQSICWVDESESLTNAKLIIGENSDVKQGESSQEIWFNFEANS